jgi:lipopolysaccharide/colanic/teichoic acid biosynthesis glycosyltransferase
VAVAVAIKLEDGGPVLFIQRRLGRGNQFFDMLKFRSMREEKLDHNGSRSTARDDDRIARIGAFIRRTSIDELP